MITPTTDIEQDHPIQDPLALILKQYCFSMTATWAAKILRSPECWVFHQVVNDAGLFFGDGHEIVSVDEGFSGFLLVVAVSTGVEKDVVGSIDFGVEKVVAFCAKVERRHGRCEERGLKVEKWGREARPEGGEDLSGRLAARMMLCDVDIGE